jgi:DNA-binding transcriptional ArsR family regulator
MSLRENDSNVNGLAKQFDMTRQAVSLHVRYLEECGVISVKKEGRNRLCQLEANELAKVNKWLEPFKELWNKRYNQLDDLLTEMQ